jgi:hypothetical protein
MLLLICALNKSLLHRVRVTLWLVVYHQATSPLTHNRSPPAPPQLNTCSHSPHVVCHLQLQSFSGLSPAGLMTIFYCLRFETPPTRRARSPHIYPPGTGWLSYNSRHWVAFLSLSMICRAMVELFDLVSTLESLLPTLSLSLLHCSLIVAW